MKELIKLAVCLFGYGLAAPLAGWWLGRFAWVRRACMAAVIILPSIPPYYVSLTVFSQDRYAGHTRGFEATILEMLCIVIIFGVWRAERKRPILLPPLARPYLIYCGLASLSAILLLGLPWPGVLVDLEADGAWISGFFLSCAIVKFFKLALVLVAVHAFVNRRQDMIFILKWGVAAVFVTLLLALKQRYLDGDHRVVAGFESYNMLGMWSYCWGLVLFATAMVGGLKWWVTLLMFAGYVAAGVSSVLSISRASVLVVALGTLFIAAMLLILVPASRKRFYFVSLVLLAGGLLAAKSWDQITQRFRDTGKLEEVADIRVHLMEQAQAMQRDSVFGVGWNNYSLAASFPLERYASIRWQWDRETLGYVRPREFYQNLGLVENFYWLVRAETGYPGFLGFVIFAGAVLWASARNALYWRRSALGPIALAIGFVFAVLLLHSYYDRVLANSKIVATLLILFGLISRMETARLRRASEP